VARAGFQKSGVSASNRMIERHPIATGAFWESYDFAANKASKASCAIPWGRRELSPRPSTIWPFTTTAAK
jgi:hypothetical protein